MPPLPAPLDVAKQVQAQFGCIPKTAVVLGSGFAPMLQRATIVQSIPTSDLNGFPPISVQGHTATLAVGDLGGARSLFLGGRAHCYEGFTPAEVTFPIRVFAALGVESVLLTNAAGAINETFRPGDFMVLRDHINFTGANPLIGSASGDSRYVDMNKAYDETLRQKLHAAARAGGFNLREGVYIGVSGPCYETPAEIRAFRTLGADAVGMSVVHEAIAARHCGLRVAGLSCITNMAAGLSGETLSHEDVIQCGHRAADRAGIILEEFLRSAN